MKCVLRCELGNLPRKLAQSLTIGSLSTLAAIAVGIPDAVVSPTRVWSLPAMAQSVSTFTNEEIRNYARAVLAMEPRRLAAYEEIRSSIGEDVPEVICNQNNTINRLQPEVQQIAVNYCTQAKAIIDSNRLTVTRFNEITQQQQSDTELKQQIQNELQRLQQSISN